MITEKEINTKQFLEEHRMELVCGKKKYRFDDIRHDVMNWSPEARKNITKQMIYMIPWRVAYWSDLDSGLIILMNGKDREKNTLKTYTKN